MSRKNYHKISRALILCAVLVTFPGIASSQTAMFGVDPQHSGVYNSTFPSDLLLTRKWSYKTNGMIFSSAVIADGVVYVGSDDSCLYAMDTNQILRWKFQSNGIIRSTPAVKDTVAYFNNYGGRLYAINTNTGEEIWHFDTDGELHFAEIGLFGWTPSDSLMNDPWDFYTSSPVISDTILYFGSGLNVYAIGIQGRQELWKYTAGDVVHSTPAVSDTIVYFGCWNGKLYALNAMTGQFIWDYSTGVDPSHMMQGIQSSPSIVDSMVIISARDASVYALNRHTGIKIWSTGFGGTWMPSSFAYSNGTIFTGASEGKGLNALNSLSGSVDFTQSQNFYFTFSTPAVSGETVFIGCLNGSLFAVDAATEKIKCRFDTDGRIKDPLNAILDDGTLNPVVFNPVSGYPYEQAVEYVRRVFTAGSIASTPSIDNNIIYFGSTDSCIYAVYDMGNCKPKTQISLSRIALGDISTLSADTSFYISNIGECSDSIMVYPDNSTATNLETATTINPSNLTIEAGDSAKIQVTVNMSGLLSKSYSLNIISQSKTNVYKTSDIEISFKKVVNSNISENDKEPAIEIYPNPFNDILYVSNSTIQHCQIKIISIDGRLIYCRDMDGIENIEINTASWSNGIYIISFKTENGEENYRLIKN